MIIRCRSNFFSSVALLIVLTQLSFLTIVTATNDGGGAVNEGAADIIPDTEHSSSHLRGRGQQEEEDKNMKRQLDFYSPECGEAGATEGIECWNYFRYKLEWPECVEDKLTNHQCMELIKRELVKADHILVKTSEFGDVFHLHTEVEDEDDIETVIDIVDTNPPPDGVIITPWTELKKHYYNRYDLIVNYAGEPIGHQIDGMIHYNGTWTYYCDPDWMNFPTSGGTNNNICRSGIEEMTFNCKGSKDSAHCENKVLNQMNALDIPIKDKKGNYLTPWVRQMSPTPFHVVEGGNDYFEFFLSADEAPLGFCVWTYDSTLGAYKGTEIGPKEQLKPLGVSKKVKAPQMKTVLEEILNKATTAAQSGTKVTYLPRDEAIGLVRNCHQHLRTLPDAGSICTELNHWVQRYTPHDIPIKFGEEIYPHLQSLLNEVIRFMDMPLKIEYKIEIHSTYLTEDGSNVVTKVPKLGHHYSNGVPVCVPGKILA